MNAHQGRVLLYTVVLKSLVGSLELSQETDIVLREHTKVAHTVFQVGDALHAYTKGIAAVDAAVDAALLKDVGVYHATTQNLYPTGVLAETAAHTAADMT